ncbi:hypothetical protein NPIL_416821 [Nephila pilipes]|uniref:Uncharacterized protein n=1 Tax=Nephila pilipes TaxID=299642 RepID=A0A8X6MVV2_NEPPI|nr:hypothetical protein NPIL_416821 [Nephila pilipes]
MFMEKAWIQLYPTPRKDSSGRVDSNLQGNSPESKSFRSGENCLGHSGVKHGQFIRTTTEKHRPDKPEKYLRPPANVKAREEDTEGGFWRREEQEEEEATRALSLPVVATIKVAILVKMRRWGASERTKKFMDQRRRDHSRRHGNALPIPMGPGWRTFLWAIGEEAIFE